MKLALRIAWAIGGAALVLWGAACSNVSQAVVPATYLAPPAVRPAVEPPAEQSVKLDLDKVVAAGGFYQVLPPTRNGSAATLSVTFTRWKGATMMVRYGPIKPAGIPPIPGATKTLVWLTITVDRTVVANGAWNVVLKNTACKPHTEGGYYPYKGKWSTVSSYACKDFVILPQWTRLDAGTTYAAAMYV